MIDIILKALIGAVFVVVIALLSKTKYYFLAGLLPLFPTFALISHYIIGTTNSPENFRNVIVLGMWSIIPYFLYLAAVYYLHTRVNIYYALAGGLAVWCAAAAVLIYFWNQ